MFKHVRTLWRLFDQIDIGSAEIIYLQFIRIPVNRREEIIANMLQVFLRTLYPPAGIIEHQDSLVRIYCSNHPVVDIFFLFLMECAVSVQLFFSAGDCLWPFEAFSGCYPHYGCHKEMYSRKRRRYPAMGNELHKTVLRYGSCPWWTFQCSPVVQHPDMVLNRLLP